MKMSRTRGTNPLPLATLLSRVVGRAAGFLRSSTRSVDTVSRVVSGAGTGGRMGRFSSFEPLEPRVLLEGSFANPVELALDPGGLASAQGAINPAQGSTDNDYYSFVMPGAANTSNFVSILADTVNEAGGSALDTRITIFAESDLNNPIVSSTVGGANAVTGVNNGTLTSGVTRDGWGGFVGRAGTRYFVIVSSDNSVGPPQQGTYTLRVSTQAQNFSVDNATGIGFAEGGAPPDLQANPPNAGTAILGVIDRLQQDIVFKYTAPDSDAFNSLVAINAQVTQGNLGIRFDSRLDIYREDGTTGRVTRLSFDSDAGRLNDAFTTFVAERGATYWIRIRGDEIRTNVPQTPTGTGSFFLVLDGRADDLSTAMDPVTRRGSASGPFLQFTDPLIAPNPAVANPRFQVGMHQFISQGDGAAFVTNPAGQTHADPAVRVFNSAGQQIAFNDNFSGNSAQANTALVGGQRYYIISDAFDIQAGTAYNLFVEANHTLSTTQPVDDHINGGIETLDPQTRRRLSEAATSLVWGPQTFTRDADGNIVRDINFRTTASGTGRIEGAGDTDLFQFTPPVDMLSNYAGNNDDEGTSLFTGGRFDAQETSQAFFNIGRGISNYDANDWWPVGVQDDGSGQVGFQANTAASGRPEIYALFDWDPDPTQGPAQGVPTDRFLVVGGDFQLFLPGAPGPISNLAVWGWSIQAQRFTWFNLGDATGGPVRAITAFDPLAPEGGTSQVDRDGNGFGTDPGQNQDPSDVEDLPQVLVVGGDFTSVGAAFGGPGGTPANRIAFFDIINGTGWNAIGAGIAGGAAPSVRALAVFDPDDPGEFRAATTTAPILNRVPDSPDQPRSLWVGGLFETAGGVASRNLAVWSGLNAGANRQGQVIGQWSTPNFGITQTPNPLGANATSQGTNAPAWIQAGANNNTIDGAVNVLLPITLTVDPDGAGPDEAGPRLLVGGEFTVIGGEAWGPTNRAVGPLDTPEERQIANRLAIFGSKQGTANRYDTQQTQYAPLLTWEPVGRGFDAAVHALAVWDPPDINNVANPARLVIGGAFTSEGLLRNPVFTDPPANPMNQLAQLPIETTNPDATIYDFALANLGGANGITRADGSPGVVRALAAFEDLDEPNIPLLDTVGTDPQEVLYIGGEFADVDGTAANNTAMFLFNPDPNVFAFEWRAMGTGTGGVSNDPLANPPQASNAAVFAFATYDDGDPNRWDRHDRPGSRLEILVSPTFGGFENITIRVLDSQFNVIWEPGANPGADTIAPPNPDPAGMLDPASRVPGSFDQQFTGLRVWGGEVYYLEVGGTGTGRYNISVTADAFAPDLSQVPDGVREDVNRSFSEESPEGAFARAAQLHSVVTNLANGDGTPRRGTETQNGGQNERSTRRVAPDARSTIVNRGDIGNLASIDDQDIYTFRAEFSGFAEIRVATTDLQDAWSEIIGTNFEGAVRTLTSHLDSVLRIFDNDFTQLAFNDDNYANLAEPITTTAGTIQGTFFRRDARVVFPVVQGNTYYVMVESGQRYKTGKAQVNRVSNFSEDVDNPIAGQNGQTISDERGFDGLREIDWRSAIGGYQLLFNQMPNQVTDVISGQTVVDDHIDANFQLATPIAIGDDPANTATNGKGTATGLIRQTPNNPDDLDLFTFLAPGNGTASIIVRPANGSTLVPFLQVVDADGNTFNGTPVGGGAVGVTVNNVRAGQIFGIAVAGNGGSGGAYTVEVSGLPVADDHADFGKHFNASDITIRDFEGQGIASGNIEQAGDSDLFRFRVQEFGTWTVDVAAVTLGFDPVVEVYEVSDDPAGNPIFLRIAQNDDISQTNTDSRARFSVTPDREHTIAGRLQGYPFYYVVVRGADDAATTGQYTVTLSFTATDDHPDAPITTGTARDTNQFGFASTISLDSVTGLGSAAGNIELAGDSDLFVFTAAASGTASVSIARATGSTLRQRVTILADVAQGQPSVLITSAVSPDAPNGIAAVNFSVVRGTRYFIVVDVPTDLGGPIPPNALTGAFTLSLAAPPIDDHPNVGEFNLATGIPLSPSTGRGQLGGDVGGDAANPRISPASDTDLFTFAAISAGTHSLIITPFATQLGTLAPRLTVFNSSFTQVQQVSAALVGQQITINLPGVTVGQRFYLLVEGQSGIAGAALTGEFRVQVNGPTPSGGGQGPDPAVIDFTPGQVPQIFIDPTTGFGSSQKLINDTGTTNDRLGLIDVANDRDLFTFTTPNFTSINDTIFIQVITPAGSLLDATVRVLRNPNELAQSESAFDADGLPGATANTSFAGLPNKQYWVVVDGVGDSVGSYILRVSTRPTRNTLVFPEGFSSGTVRETVSITNPNPVAADFTIIFRYETGDLETVVTGGSVAANSRTTVTINDLGNKIAGLRADAPYAIIIESSQQLSARLDHSDFGGSIGESFTNVVSPTWNFPRVERQPGAVEDFIVFYNPNNFDVNVTMTAYQNGAAVSSITSRFGALRRGGWAINDLPNFPFGTFSVVLAASAADAGNAQSFTGVVASLSHYDRVRSTAFGAIGDQGSTVSAVPSFTQGTQSEGELVIFNPNATTASVTISGSYVRAALPGISQTRDIAPRGTLVLRGNQLGLVQNQPIGLRFNSSLPISVLASQQQRGDADASASLSEAGTRFFFGDALINSAGAGTLFFNTLNFYNPTNVAANVSVRLLFADGTTSLIPISLSARGYAELNLHQRTEVTSRSGDVRFAVDATANVPFAMSMTYYDLQRGGGFTADGSPFGLTLPLNRIS